VSEGGWRRIDGMANPIVTDKNVHNLFTHRIVSCAGSRWLDVFCSADGLALKDQNVCL